MGGRKGFTSVTMTGRLQRTGVLQSSVMLIVVVTVADIEKEISNKWMVCLDARSLEGQDDQRTQVGAG